MYLKGSVRKLVQWAFQQDKPGVISDFDNDTRYMVVKLDKVANHDCQKKAEDVREEISGISKKRKKGKDLVDQLNKAETGTTDLAA